MDQTTQTEVKKHRQKITGVVVSDKMNKTRVVETKRSQQHRLYRKGVTRGTRIFVHDEKNESKMGDLVTAISTRRLSGNKNFQMVKIEKRAAT